MAKKQTIELSHKELSTLVFALNMTGDGSEALRKKLRDALNLSMDDKRKRALERATQTKENANVGE